MSVFFRPFSTCANKFLIPLANAYNVPDCAAVLKTIPWSNIPQKDLVEFVNDALKWQADGGFNRTRGQMLMMAASKTLNDQSKAAFRAGSAYRALAASHVEVEPK
jgi:hypothetical protein